MAWLDIILWSSSAVLFIVAIITAVIGWRSETRLSAVVDTETNSAAEIEQLHGMAVAGGSGFGRRCEVSGVVECDLPLTTPYSHQSCAVYDYYVIQEQWQRQRSGGNWRNPAGHANTVSNVFTDHDARQVAFWVRDSSGRVRIDPTAAEFDLAETANRYEQYSASVGSGERNLRRTEKALLTGSPVYVLGYLADRAGEPALSYDPTEQQRQFLVSHRNEQALRQSLRTRSYLHYLAAGVAGGSAGLLAVAGWLF